MRIRLLFWTILAFILFSQGDLFPAAAEEMILEREREAVQDIKQEIPIEEEFRRARQVRPRVPTIKELFIEPLLPRLDLLQRQPKLQPPKLIIPKPPMPIKPITPLIPKPQLPLPASIGEIPKPQLPALPRGAPQIELPPAEVTINEEEESLNQD